MWCRAVSLTVFALALIAASIVLGGMLPGPVFCAMLGLALLGLGRTAAPRPVYSPVARRSRRRFN